MDSELASAGFPTSSELVSDIGPKPDLADLQAVSEAYQPGQKESDSAPDAATLAAAAAKNASQAPEARPNSPTSSLDFSTAVSKADSTDQRHNDAQIKRVLVGHSLGAACAAAEVIRHSKVTQTFPVHERCLYQHL